MALIIDYEKPSQFIHLHRCHSFENNHDCSIRCNKILFCGHSCDSPCHSTPCEPCKKLCNVKCVHSKCSKKCYELVSLTEKLNLNENCSDHFSCFISVRRVLCRATGHASIKENVSWSAVHHVQGYHSTRRVINDKIKLFYVTSLTHANTTASKP